MCDQPDKPELRRAVPSRALRLWLLRMVAMTCFCANPNRHIFLGLPDTEICPLDLLLRLKAEDIQFSA
jgi:hypothetical protein